MPAHHPAPPQAASVGPLVELSRYRIATGERVLRGQRILGVVRITDAAADGCGRTYIVERGLTSKAELVAIVADYVLQARRFDDIPLLHLYPDNEVTS